MNLHHGNLPRPGEVPLKQWIWEQSEKQNVSYDNMVHRLYRGRVPYPEVRRINARVIFVKRADALNH
jgi:hypothetical protein